MHKKYGIKINELNPDGGSGDEIEAIKANKGNKGPQAPDVIDVGLSFGPDAKAAGLLAPYKVQTWSTIPDNVKDPTGYWYGDYYGALAFEVNIDIVKDVPAGLVGPAQARVQGQGRPVRRPAHRQPGHHDHRRRGASQRRQLRRTCKPGLKFFDKLNKAGNFVPLIAVPGTVASGETPITIRWDYNALANRDKTRRQPEHLRHHSRHRRRGGRLHPGHQRLRSASQRRPALGGVPLFRRRPDHLAQGLRTPGPLQRPGQARRDSRRRGGQDAARRRVRQGGLPHPRPADRGTRAIADDWDKVVNVKVQAEASSVHDRRSGSQDAAGARVGQRAPSRAVLGQWAGLAPFFLFALAFMLLPAGSILVGSFQDARGAFTLANFAHLFRPNILHSYSSPSR